MRPGGMPEEPYRRGDRPAAVRAVKVRPGAGDVRGSPPLCCSLILSPASPTAAASGSQAAGPATKSPALSRAAPEFGARRSDRAAGR